MTVRSTCSRSNSQAPNLADGRVVFPSEDVPARIAALPIRLAHTAPDTLQYSLVISITYANKSLA